ncbi:hypothetical protein D0T11_06615 [Hymenobacter rubripertinctus]|uniref:Uncharacterized protein n=2 Tax=Hymenobacter rubripertinctus TaxID=2029981 RepID=A0A418R396_9BACT|nr:hypothetical protein D0T11_06615 [Hymenobacter rubripertinctus]
MVYVEQVVDGRPGKPPFGMVYVGITDRPTVALFRQGMEPQLTAFLREQLPARPTDQPVVLCVRQLRISETMNYLREEARADLAFDVYAHLPDGYHFMQSAAAHTAQRALLSTGLHDGHLAELLQQCLRQLRPESWPAAAQNPVRTLAQLATDSPADQPATLNAAILREPLRPGVYRTFEQFLANQPAPGFWAVADTVAFGHGSPNARHLWYGVPRLRVKVVNEGGHEQAARQVWGFSDGRQLFVQHQNNFFPLHRYHNSFTFVGETPGDVAYMQARAQAYGRAKMQAAIIGAGASRVAGVDHTAEPMGYAVDMRTGEAGQFPNLLLPAPACTDTAYIYMYRYADASTAPIPFSLDNRAAGQLRPQEYLEIPWPYPGRVVRLCLELPGLPCQLVIPNPARFNYLRITANGKASKRPICEWVSAAQGEADLDEIDRQRSSPAR